MTLRTRSSLIGTLALVASLSAPLAFAQSATADAAVQAATPPASAQAEAAVAATPAQGTAAVGADATSAPAAAAKPGAQPEPQAAVAATGTPARKSWSDVDVDKNGSLSKAEVASVPSLGQVFDKADDNADGALTTAEYKNYVAKAQAKGGAGK